MIVLPTKIINQTISVDTKTTKLTLDSTIRSYDNQDTIIKLTLTSELDLDFNNATAKAAIEYYADKKYVVETPVNVSDNTLSFSLPTNLKGYDGYAIIGVYVDLADESKIDIKDLVVKCEPSIIDKAAVDAQPYYFSNLDSVLIEFKQYANSKADELDNDVISAKQEIADKVASVDSRSAVETITSKVADVDRGNDAMINFFVEQILIGRITIEDVPMLWRRKVQAKLDELNTDEGLDGHGYPVNLERIGG